MSDPKPLPEAVKLTIVDAPHAPFIYFEEAPAVGHVNGLIRVTLSADVTLTTEGTPKSTGVAVAYLRTNAFGARALINALQGALLLAQPVEKPEGLAN